MSPEVILAILSIIASGLTVITITAKSFAYVQKKIVDQQVEYARQLDEAQEETIKLMQARIDEIKQTAADEAKRLRTDLVQLKAERDKTERELRQTVNDLTAARGRITDLERTQNDLSQQLIKQSAELQRLRGMEQKVADAEDQARRAKNDLDVLTRKYQKAETQAEALQEQVDKLRGRIDELESSRDYWQSKAGELEIRLKTMKEEQSSNNREEKDNV